MSNCLPLPLSLSLSLCAALLQAFIFMSPHRFLFYFFYFFFFCSCHLPTASSLCATCCYHLHHHQGGLPLKRSRIVFPFFLYPWLKLFAWGFACFCTRFALHTLYPSPPHPFTSLCHPLVSLSACPLVPCTVSIRS